MTAVTQVSAPLANAGPHIGVHLRLRVLPRSNETPAPLLDLRDVEDADPTTSPIQLLEGHEYGYEWILSQVVEGSVSTDPEELFFPDDEGGTKGRLRTALTTGSLRVTLRKGDVVMGSLDLEVRSRKLNYLTEYRWMLRDISKQMSELTMQRFAAAAAHFVVDPTRDAITLYQRFEFLRAVLADERLDAGLRLITQNPHVSWKQSQEIVQPSHSTRASSELVRSMSKAGRRQEWSGGPISSIPIEITQTRTEATHDTAPNRFVRFALERWRQVVSDIDLALRNEHANPTLARARREVTQVLDRLDAILSHEIFVEVGRLNYFPADNQVLHRRAGYRDVYQAYLEFELAAHLCWRDRERDFAAGQRDVAQLYEYWVFFQLAQLIAELTGVSLDLSSVLNVSASGLNIGLKAGRQTVVSGVLERGTRKLAVSFCFNRTFSPADSVDGSWTLSMRPDYSLKISDAGEDSIRFEPVQLHFDAKYKLSKVEELFEADPSEPTPVGKAPRSRAKHSDLLKMHAYRDAIRRSAGAYVVYPGNEADAQQIQQFVQYREVLPGLGAFVLRPSEDGRAAGSATLRKFLDQVFDHIATRLSRHERGRFWAREAYTRYDFRTGATAFAFGEPDENATLLLGYVKSMEHWQWIQERMAYNVRTEERPGGVAANSDLLFSQLLILYSQQLGIVAGARIVGGPERLSKADMLALKYPNPRGDYLCVQLSSLELPMILTRINASELEDFVVAQGVRQGQPIAVSWGLLRRILGLGQA